MASQIDDKLEWVQYDQCEVSPHIMCKSIPGCQYPQIELMASYICSKYRFDIVALHIVLSAYNVHIFAIVEKLQSRQNMFKVLEPLECQINDMEHKDFTLPGGFKVKVFLNGDFKMFDFVMGHQGSTSWRNYLL